MCRSVVDIQSLTAENRRGKKEERKIETTGQKYNGLPYSIVQGSSLVVSCSQEVTNFLFPVRKNYIVTKMQDVSITIEIQMKK